MTAARASARGRGGTATGHVGLDKGVMSPTSARAAECKQLEAVREGLGMLMDEDFDGPMSESGSSGQAVPKRKKTRRGGRKLAARRRRKMLEAQQMHEHGERAAAEQAVPETAGSENS